MKKKVFMMALLSLFAVCSILVGCGTDNRSSEQKVLRVGTNPDFAPFEFSDGKSEEYQGFDMDLIRAVGKEMGYKVEIKNMNFDGLIPALEADNIDLIASGMTITPEREKSVSFSHPYYTSGLTIMVPANAKDINSFADLKGKKIAVQLGTASMTEAQKVPDAEVKALNSSADVYVELKSGHVDAVINDRPVNAYFIKTTDDKNLRVLDEILVSQKYGFAMRKNDEELVKKVNQALYKLKENGEYAKLYEKWFGTKPSEEDLKDLN